MTRDDAGSNQRRGFRLTQLIFTDIDAVPYDEKTREREINENWRKRGRRTAGRRECGRESGGEAG